MAKKDKRGGGLQDQPTIYSHRARTRFFKGFAIGTKPRIHRQPSYFIGCAACVKRWRRK